ncbi:MAG: biotin carboxylase N-terminal domain-containing protein [Rhodospirillales bacterium]|jgi:3-methylcrotonyl-CoA carboxylase alpha subunit|nr:biotin carboxylase N-terminal domain-containing protein [Rhodospirillales bacterium]HJO75659.1 biotin carboxylase N-terminal domain-containing protein [Rhodospirillales bacterium]
MTISKILIANRGEIACRIIRSCRDLGIATAAIYSEADAGSLHVTLADEAFAIGPPPAAKSYLDQDAILAALKSSGADAVHPGYGFLAENARFAAAVENSGRIWIGARPKTIEDMGDKERARDIAKASGVPVLPGSPRFRPGDLAGLTAAGESVGYPLLVKAAAGGGGIGMRLVETADTLQAQVETTQALAERSFGDGTVYLERLVARARHIEVQVFGFGDGGGVHFFDRDCSVQRRFQKVIEEAPAPDVPRNLRQEMHEAALRLVAHGNYRGAGTVEFIYDGSRQAFYFLEMNTRIQVEHAASEMITGQDLVNAQIALASGNFTAPSQEDIIATGHAIECRIYAERPEKNFLPSPGNLTRFRLPDENSALRIDHGFREGDQITPYYDPMIAKVIVRGDDRKDAIERMLSALGEISVEGVSTNLTFLKQMLLDPVYRTDLPTTRYVEQGSHNALAPA